jgi:hypothetical protein
MKRHLFLGLAGLGMICSAFSEDAIYVYQALFGSEELSENNIGSSDKNPIILKRLWGGIDLGRKLMATIRPNASRDEIDDKHAIFIEKMLELRAFANQHKEVPMTDAQKEQFLKIDSFLKSLNLFYSPDDHEKVLKACRSMDDEALRKLLKM